ncbi:hypothetical protein JOE09_004499 [Pantoea coffeiphila]|nr:hypothetical protein [Pantoea coffeiphila]
MLVCIVWWLSGCADGGRLLCIVWCLGDCVDGGRLLYIVWCLRGCADGGRLLYIVWCLRGCADGGRPRLAVLAPLRGALTSFVSLSDRLRRHIRVPTEPCARVLRAHPGFLSPFSAADCPSWPPPVRAVTVELSSDQKASVL